MIAWLASHLWLILSGLGATGVGVLGFTFPAVSVPILEAIWGWLCHRSFWQLVCLALGCVIVVQHFTIVGAHQTIAKQSAQITKIQAADDAAIAKAKAADTQIAALTKQLKDATDAQNRAIADDAGTLRVSGPGKSRCPAVPVAASDGNGIAKPDAAGPPLPPAIGEDLSAVPWGWLTVRAEEHDQLLNEVKAWRAWHDEVLKAWPKSTGAPQ